MTVTASINRFLLTSFVSLTSICASATPILVDFADVSVDVIWNENFVSQGVSFSPNCHQHISILQAAPSPIPGSVPSAGGNWLGFDPSGCDTINNENYLGPAGVGLAGKMFVSLADHGQFDLSSFDFVRYDSGPQGLVVESSRGGYFSFTGATSYDHFAFADAAWTGLDWLVFSQPYTATYSGFDNLVLERNVVPEPSSTAAWIALLAALMTCRYVHFRHLRFIP
jgi:hypothetical protein